MSWARKGVLSASGHSLRAERIAVISQRVIVSRDAGRKGGTEVINNCLCSARTCLDVPLERHDWAPKLICVHRPSWWKIYGRLPPTPQPGPKGPLRGRIGRQYPAGQVKIPWSWVQVVRPGLEKNVRPAGENHRPVDRISLGNHAWRGQNGATRKTLQSSCSILANTLAIRENGGKA